MSGIQSLGPSPWIPSLAHVAKVDKVLAEQLGELARHMRDLHQLVEHGPVPGGYLPVSFEWSQDSLNGPYLAAGDVLAAAIPVAMTPVAVSAICLGGTNLTVTLTDANAVTFFGPEVLTAGTAASFTESGDFPQGRYELPPGRIDLDVTAIDSQGVFQMKVILWCKRPARMDG